MAITHAPAIVTNGLVLHYDMSNAKKSFKGPPIVNNTPVPTPDVSGYVTFPVNGTGQLQRIYSGTFGDYTVNPADIVYSYTLGVLGCHYKGSQIYPSPGQQVTFSVDYYISPTCVNYPSTNYIANMECYETSTGSYVYLAGAGATDPTPSVVGVWKTVSITTTVPANSTTPIISGLMYPGACGSGKLADSGFILYRNPQLEVNGFRTPFVNGTRTNTQSILNLANPYETQNYIPYPYASYNGSAFVLSYNKSDLGATYTYQTSVANPVNAPGVLQYYTGTGGYQYFAVRSNAVPVTAKYTFSYYARLTSGSSSSGVGFQQIWRQSVLGSDSTPTGDWNPTYTTTWKRYTLTGNITAGNGIDMFLAHSSAMVAGITMQFCGFQLEPYPKLTPFSPTTGTSSTTNTITASSLTYASDNTFSFNGSSNYITATTNTDFQFLGVQPFTLEAWVYPTSNPGATGFPGIICRESNPGSGRDGYNLLFHGSATTETSFAIERFSAGTGASYYHYLDSSITLNNWHHIVATYDGFYLRLYRNASELGSASQSTAITNTTAPLNIGMLGQTPASTLNFPGKIAVAKIYKNALTAAEVLQNFNALRGRFGL